MATRYEYKCNKCGHDYVEQRRDDELNPFFANCVVCSEGINEEINKVFIEPDVEIVPVIVEPVIE
jgi:predicted SprT family Zn-dependent metalloprotease